MGGVAGEDGKASNDDHTDDGRDIEGALGVQYLLPKEREHCAKLHVVPRDYLRVKVWCRCSRRCGFNPSRPPVVTDCLVLAASSFLGVLARVNHHFISPLSSRFDIDVISYVGLVESSCVSCTYRLPPPLLALPASSLLSLSLELLLLPKLFVDIRI